MAPGSSLGLAAVLLAALLPAFGVSQVSESVASYRSAAAAGEENPLANVGGEIGGKGPRFLYLVHTAHASSSSWVRKTFEGFERACVIAIGIAPYVRHDLYTVGKDIMKGGQEFAGGGTAKHLQYFIFIDADVVTPTWEQILRFEAFLLEWLPAVGLPFLEPIYGHWSFFAPRPAWPWAQWDDAMVAYHVLAASKLFAPHTTPGFMNAGWVARWRHRVWALMLYPGRVLLSSETRVQRRQGGTADLPVASLLWQIYTQMVDLMRQALARRFIDRGDLWRSAVLCIPTPMQPYGPVISNSLGDGQPRGCFKCFWGQALPGVPSEYPAAEPKCTEVIPGDGVRMHGLAQKRLHWVFLESDYNGGFSGTGEHLASLAMLPIEAARRYSAEELAASKEEFGQCMAPGEVRPPLDYLPEIALRVRQLPVRSGTFLYVLLTAGPLLEEACWWHLLERTDTWLVVVTWKEPLIEAALLQDERVTAAYFPKSNIQEAKLSQHWITMEVILAQGWRFDYVVRVDSDACLVFSTMLDAEVLGWLKEEDGSPIGVFHELLLKDRPPVAVVHNVVDASQFSGPFNRSFGPWDLERPCIQAWDHRFHAVSADALLFYAFDLAFQPINWNTADVSVLYRLAAVFAGRTVSYSVVELDVRTLSSSAESYLKALGDDLALPTVSTSWDRTWLPMAHRAALGLPPHLRARALYSYWMEWEAGDGASDCLPPVAQHADLYEAAPEPEQPWATCAAQRHPHLRWPLRSGGLVLVTMLERLITDFLIRLRRIHHHWRDDTFKIDGFRYPGRVVEAATVREIALHLRVYELVSKEAIEPGLSGGNHSLPFSQEVHAQLRAQIEGYIEFYSHIDSLEAAARAFQMEGGPAAFPSRPLLMHLQLRSKLEELPASQIAHHDPRPGLPRPKLGQFFYGSRWLSMAAPAGSAEEERLCQRAAKMPAGGGAVLCMSEAADGPPREMDLPGSDKQGRNHSLLELVGPRLGPGFDGRNCSDWLGLRPGAPVRAAACFRELVQGFRYAGVVIRSEGQVFHYDGY